MRVADIHHGGCVRWWRDCGGGFADLDRCAGRASSSPALAPLSLHPSLGPGEDGDTVATHRRLGCTGVYVSNRVSDKITGVDERIYVCRSGSAADTQAVSDYVTHYLNQHR